MADVDLHDVFESWKPISFHDDLEVSNFGHVRKISNGRIMPQHLDTSGYYVVAFGKGLFRRRTSVLICDAFHGPRPSPLHMALHNNGRRTDNRSVNLRWGTQQENRDDMVLHGTVLKGELNGSAKLSDELIAEIRATFPPGRRRGDGITQAAFARKHGCSQAAVSLVVTKRSWRHV